MFPSLLAGVLYGTNFNPPQHLIDQAVTHPEHTVHSTEGADYIFSHFCGIFLTTLLYFVVYCVGKVWRCRLTPV